MDGLISASELHESQALVWSDTCIRQMWAQERVEIVEVGRFVPRLGIDECADSGFDILFEVEKGAHCQGCWNYQHRESSSEAIL